MNLGATSNPKTGWFADGLATDGADLGSMANGSARFNTKNDYVYIHFSGTAGALTYSLNVVNTTSSAFEGEFVVEESANNGSYVPIATYNANNLIPKASGGTQFSVYPSATAKYIRFNYTDRRNSQNILLDAVKLVDKSAADINVKQGLTDYFTSSTYTFIPKQNVKTVSNAAAFTIQNLGLSGLGLTGTPRIALTGANAAEFIVDQSQVSSTIAAGGSNTFTVSFAPTSFGDKTASLIINSDDYDEINYEIKLAATAEFVAPVVTSINPMAGPVGSQVVITGSNLINTTNVAFNGTEAAFTIDNNNQITATVPFGATDGPIKVTNPNSFVNSADFDVTISAPPTIAGFTPGQGAVGASVVINGANFTNASSVKFNATPASFTVNTDGTQITATVPANATTGPISVTTLGGTATSTANFQILLFPIINSFSPGSGTAGNPVVVQGVNFTGTTAVRFNGTLAGFTLNNDGQLTAIVPQGATSGTITVTTPNGTATSSASFTVTVQGPVITNLSPAAGAVGDDIIISGYNLADAISVKFYNGVIAQFYEDDDANIVAKVPANATTGPITVETSGGTATSETFTVNAPAPTITGLSPASGVVGAQITIEGTNFTGITSVTFNGVSASFTVNSATSISAVVPAGATTGPISVITANHSATSSNFQVNTQNTTYTWRVNSGNWTDADNWVPVRNNPSTADVLIFDGDLTSSPTINVNFTSSQTIGQLKFINGINATLNVAADKILNLDNSVAGTDFMITSGASLLVTNSVNRAKLDINITGGETGIVAGNLMLQASTGNSSHKIVAQDVDGLIFQGGSIFRSGNRHTGNPFGANNPNAVRFASGSILINQGGDSPFGAVAPNTVLLFDPGSLYRHEANTAPDLNDRIYSNFELNEETFMQSVAGTGKLTVNNLIVTNGINFDINLTGGVSIGGNIHVAAGALNFTPASSSNITLTGAGTKTITGPGILSLGANARLLVPVNVIADLQKQIIGTGDVVVNGVVKTNIQAGFAGGANTALITGITHTLNAGSTIEYYRPGLR
jgi:hypothetical protein